ncbi:MAG: DMT family transporter [Ruminococcus sp.]|nr:DMT family transporter [Ruminococcus sp.]MBQ7008007.1 DMT family transporter [Ruminococcus sp.]
MKSKYKGIFFIILSAFFFALMALFIRIAGDIHFVQKAFFRNLIAFFFALAIMIKNKEKITIRRKYLPDLLMRAVAGTIGIFCNFFAIEHLVLSDASMLNKMSPFFAILFSYLILKEKLNLRQGLIVFLAFIGSLFIVRPTTELFHNPASIIGLIGGIAAGAAYTFVRRLGQNGENKSMIVLFFSGFSCLVTVPYLIFSFEPMTAKQLAALIGAGLSAAGGQFSITAAYFHAPAKEISVYDYSQLIFSMLLGFVFFGQIPEFMSIIGYAVIIASAVMMFIYNTRRKDV